MRDDDAKVLGQGDPDERPLDPRLVDAAERLHRRFEEFKQEELKQRVPEVNPRIRVSKISYTANPYTGKSRIMNVGYRKPTGPRSLPYKRFTPRRSFYRPAFRRFGGRGRFSRFTKSRAAMKKPTFNQAEQDYIEAVSNPFGKQGSQYNMGMGAKIVDPSGSKTLAITLMASATVNGGGGEERGITKICFPNVTDDVAFRTHWSNGAGTPTNTTVANWTNFAMVRPNIQNYRIVGMGLKITCTSNGQNVGGHLQGGLTTAETYPGGYLAFTVLTPELEFTKLSTDDGMTVRWTPQAGGDMLYHPLAAAVPAGRDLWRAPCIYHQGLLANSVLLVEAVMHLEVDFPEQASPFPLLSSPTSTKWLLIYAMVTNPNLAPIVTKGQSFSSFFTASGLLLRKIIRWIYANQGALLSIGRGVSMLM